MRARLRQFGPCTVEGAPGHEVRFETQRSAKLLGFLSVATGRKSARDVLCEVLWPDDFLDATRLRLRQELSRTRRALGPIAGILAGEGDMISLQDSEVVTDLELLARTASMSVEDAAEFTKSLAGEFFAGWTDEWVFAERERAHQVRAEVSVSVGQRLLDAGKFAEAVAVVQPAIACDPANEALRLIAVEGYGRMGSLSEAMRAFQEMKRAIGREPSAAALQVLQALQSEPKPRPSAPTVQFSAPRPIDRFFGREDELLLGESLLREGTRWISVTGPGGIGKSRFALELIQRVEDAFPGGIGFVSLSEIDEAEQIVASTLQQLGMQLPPSVDPVDYLTRMMPATPCLILFDNLEHLGPEAANSLRRLSERAPDLTVLATSRLALRIAGERVIHLRPLDSASDGRAMLIDLWQSVRPGLRQLDGSGVEELLTTLGGIPLAIRLAASRLKLLQPAQLARQIAEHPEVLRSDAPDLAERHRSLQNTIAWSLSTLSAVQLRALVALASWRGPMDVDQAASLIDAPDALGSLELLVDASLVEMDEANGSIRIAMLEPVRSYVRVTVGAEAVREADSHHVDVLHGLVEALVPDCLSPLRFAALEELDGLRENVVSALTFLVVQGDVPRMAAFLRRASRHMTVRGRHAEVLEWLRHVPRESLSPEVAADLVAAEATATSGLAIETEALRLHAEARDAYQRIGRKDAAADQLATTAFVLRRLGEADAAITTVREAVAEAESAGARLVAARGRQLLSILHHQRHDYEAAVVEGRGSFEVLQTMNEDMLRTIGGQLLAAFQFDAGHREAALALAHEIRPDLERLGDPIRLAYQHEVDGRAAFDIGDFDAAEASFRTSLELWLRLNVAYQIADQEHSIARCCFLRGADEEAEGFAGSAIRRWLGDSDWAGLTRSLVVLARIRARQSSPDAAAILGWVIELESRHGVVLSPTDQVDRDGVAEEVLAPESPPFGDPNTVLQFCASI